MIEELNEELTNREAEKCEAGTKPKLAIKDAADSMKDDRNLPPDSKMEKAVEQSKEVGQKEAARQAEQQRDRR
jgi:hypothetical protein